MIVAMLVSVLVDGKLIASSRSAELTEGVIRAPLDPFVRRIAERITSDGRYITLVRGRRTVTIVVGSRLVRAAGTCGELPFAPFSQRGEPVVPLAALARALGAEAVYDGPTRTLVVSSAPQPLVTMTPFTVWVAPAGPLPTFPPVAAPTPRPTVSALPLPRRTPVVVDAEHPPS
ncbi:MAG: stalk domain-containing protein [Candidatus Baltobacteraceae bacterium]|jgi:hypothetical protein